MISKTLKESTNYQSKGSRSQIAAFLLLFIPFILFIGCESPGSVGDDIIQDEEAIERTIVPVNNIDILSENSFSGRLQYTALGYFEDPVYGTVKSTALFKPVISQTQIDTISEETSMYLRLIFDSEVYGSESGTSRFEVYEAGEIWRGNQLRFNNEISIDYNNKLGEFELADEDTLIFELPREWINKFSEFFYLEADRDSLYRQNFPGIAVVPSENNQKVRFLKHVRTEDEDLITSFLIRNPVEDDENGNGDENGNDNGDENGDNDNDEPEEEPGVQVVGLRDYGASFIRSNQPETETGVVIHNSERVIRLNIDFPKETLRSENIVNAQLVLTKSQSLENQFSGINRLRANLARIYVLREEPRDLMAELFTINPSNNPNVFNGILDDGEETFKIDVTQFVLDSVFGESENRKPFLTIQGFNGKIYSSTFFDSKGPENFQPRIVITTIK